MNDDEALKFAEKFRLEDAFPGRPAQWILDAMKQAYAWLAYRAPEFFRVVPKPNKGE